MRKSISFILALLGLFDSLYLFWVYTSPSRPMVCFGTGGCDAVRASAYSQLFGQPMPVFGVAAYVLVALLIIAESLAPQPLAIELRYALAGVTTLGFLYSLYLEYLQGFVIHHFCTWCVTSGVVMTALCALSVYNVVRPAQEPDAAAQLTQVRSYFVLGVLALVIGVPAFYELAAHGEAPPPPPPPATDATTDRLVRPDSHVAGNPQAGLTVVEFGDLECPACGREEPVAKEIRAKYADRIRFVFRQFPLTHSHPFSMRMAEASECAGDQGKFWEALDEIYSRQDDSMNEQGLQRDAADIGLNLDKFNQCMANSAESARIKRDQEDGKALGVSSTPTFFVGRQVAPGLPDVAEFSRLIDQALAAEGVSPPVAPPATSAAPAAGTTNGAKPGSGSENPAPASSSSTVTESPLGLLGSSSGGALSAFQTGVTCSEDEAKQKQPTLIRTSQLRDLLAAKTNVLFVDVRSPKEYAAGRIDEAINIPVDDMPSRWNTLPKDRVIVLYESGKASGDICAAGRAAGRILLEHGYAFDHVKVYQDGLAGWEKSGRANHRALVGTAN